MASRPSPQNHFFQPAGHLWHWAQDQDHWPDVTRRQTGHCPSGPLGKNVEHNCIKIIQKAHLKCLHTCTVILSCLLEAMSVRKTWIKTPPPKYCIPKGIPMTVQFAVIGMTIATFFFLSRTGHKSYNSISSAQQLGFFHAVVLYS